MSGTHDSQSFLDRRNAVVAPAVASFHPLSTAVSAKGAIITDADGREVIDFASGIGVMNVGHCHPAVVEAVREQAGLLLHNCLNVTLYEPYLALCEKLAELFPHGDATKVFLASTGAEAVENAIKVARQSTGRQGVICFSDAFHGRTMMAMTLTSKVGYKIGCGPFAPEVYRLPYPNRYKRGQGMGEGEFVERELGLLREAFTNVVAPDQVAAIIIEPVQGEGGFCVAPTAYLRGLREICDQTGIRLICDEVQSGFCRTGKWASYEYAGITPDISTWAKSLGGGMPVSAVIAKAELMDACKPGTMGGTYAGNPVACAAALAAIGVMENENLNERAIEIGGRTRSMFEALQSRHPELVGDVRGLGAMVAMEIVEGGDRERPNAAFTKSLLASCLERGLLLITAGTGGNIVRVLSPLVITDEQLERGLTILDEEFEALASGTTEQALAGAR